METFSKDLEYNIDNKGWKDIKSEETQIKLISRYLIIQIFYRVKNFLSTQKAFQNLLTQKRF